MRKPLPFAARALLVLGAANALFHVVVALRDARSVAWMVTVPRWQLYLEAAAVGLVRGGTWFLFLFAPLAGLAARRRRSRPE
jgi:hypothetical protein